MLATVIGLVNNPTARYGAIAVALVGAIIVLRLDAYNDGVEDTVAKYEKRIQEERERVSAANSQALEEARSRIEQMNEKLRQRDAEILQLNEAAKQDPNADRDAIGADSVRRLNRPH